MSQRPPPPICMLRGHEGVVTALHFTNEESDGLTEKPSLISGSDAGEIFIWNLQTCRTYNKFKCHDGKMILYLYYYKSSLLSQGRDGLIHIWKFLNGKWAIMNSFICPNYGFCVFKLFPSEENTYLIAPTGDGSSLTFYDYETRSILYNYEYKTSTTAENNLECGRETCMCINVLYKNGELLIFMGYDSGYISLWKFEAKKEISRLKCHTDVLLCMDFDAKYKNRGISGSVDNVLTAWTISEDEILIKVHQVTITNRGVNAIKIREDGKIVITAGQDCAIRIFSWKNLKPLAVLQFHLMPVTSLQCCIGSFKNYKSIFASGSKDKTICLWSIY